MGAGKKDNQNHWEKMQVLHQNLKKAPQKIAFKRKKESEMLLENTLECIGEKIVGLRN